MEKFGEVAIWRDLKERFGEIATGANVFASNKYGETP